MHEVITRYCITSQFIGCNAYEAILMYAQLSENKLLMILNPIRSITIEGKLPL